MHRRHFLASLAAASTANAIEPFARSAPKFTGLSMTTYSMKRHMKWWWGKPTDGALDMFDFLDYCARLGLDAAEITSYFFPKDVDVPMMHQLKRYAHVRGIDFSGAAMGNNFGFCSRSRFESLRDPIQEIG